MNDLTRMISNLMANGVAVNTINANTNVVLDNDGSMFIEELSVFNIMDRNLHCWVDNKYHFIGSQSKISINDVSIIAIDIEEHSKNHITSYTPEKYKLTLSNGSVRYAYGYEYREIVLKEVDTTIDKYSIGSKIPSGTTVYETAHYGANKITVK